MAQAHPDHTAVVTRHLVADETDLYMKVDDKGRVSWTEDPREASAFTSMREAARMAFRLPAELRAFGMPLDVETDVYIH